MVIGEGGLIWQANNAKVEHRAATVDEEVLAWKAEKQMAKYTTGITPQKRDAFIDDQASRGLLTEEEAETAKRDGKVKIGSRIIDYGEDETSETIPTEEVGILLDKTDEIIGVDDELKITASINPANKKVTWKSSVDGIATVVSSESEDKIGTVTGKSAGKVTITASITLDDGNTKTATCQVEAKSRFSDIYEETKTREDEGTATIPGGYAVGISSDVNDENKGLVITDEIETVGKNHYSTGNEFVWVPVPDINDMAKKQDGNGENWEGKLYDFKSDATKGSTSTEKTNYGVKTTSYREPAIVTGTATQYDANSTNLNKIQEELTMEAFKTQLQSEFNSMIKSVDKYKGFYIGRYETSELDTESPKVKKDVIPTTSIDWYEMYKNSKGVAKENSSVTSNMVWGCQWDAVMNWFIRCGGDTAKYVTDSTGKGHYRQNSEATTGSNPAYRVNNIYDMAGNVWEWTLEANSTNGRVYRGGYYTDSGSLVPASYRNGYDPLNTFNYVGSRVTLYVNLPAEQGNP